MELGGLGCGHWRKGRPGKTECVVWTIRLRRVWRRWRGGRGDGSAARLPGGALKRTVRRRARRARAAGHLSGEHLGAPGTGSADRRGSCSFACVCVRVMRVFGSQGRVSLS